MLSRLLPWARVVSFAVAGATATRGTRHSFRDSAEYIDALGTHPEDVVLMPVLPRICNHVALRRFKSALVRRRFGTNDAKSGVWDEVAFRQDYGALLAEFASLSPPPRVHAISPPPLFFDGVYNMPAPVAVVNTYLRGDTACRKSLLKEFVGRVCYKSVTKERGERFYVSKTCVARNTHTHTHTHLVYSRVS